MSLDRVRLQSIIDMFLNCEIKHSYIIFINNTNERKQIFKFLEQYLPTKENLKIKTCGGNIEIMNLNNGATFRTILVNDSSKGYKGFLSLYSDTCSTDIINCIIKPISLMCLSFNIDKALEEG